MSSLIVNHLTFAGWIAVPSILPCYIFQQKSHREEDPDGLFSISKTCIPAIVVRIREGDKLRTTIFDAKYRSSWQSIHAALWDIPVYRDAIRKDAEHSAIEAAFILTPAHLLDLDRYYTKEYREKYSFGGFDLAPRNPQQFEALVLVLKNWIG